MALPPALLHMTSEPVPWHPPWVHQNLGPCSTRCRQPQLVQPNPLSCSLVPRGALCQPHSPSLAMESREPPILGLPGWERDRLCSEHLTGEPGPSLHSYLHPGAGDPGNKAMCVWQQVGASPGVAPTSQTHFKARASSTECHRDLFLLLSLTLSSTQSPPPAGLAQPWQHRAGRHFVPLLSLPGRALAPGTAAAPQDTLCWGSSALPSPSCGWQGSDSPRWARSC